MSTAPQEPCLPWCSAEAAGFPRTGTSGGSGPAALGRPSALLWPVRGSCHRGAPGQCTPSALVCCAQCYGADI